MKGPKLTLEGLPILSNGVLSVFMRDLNLSRSGSPLSGPENDPRKIDYGQENPLLGRYVERRSRDLGHKVAEDPALTSDEKLKRLPATLAGMYAVGFEEAYALLRAQAATNKLEKEFRE